MKALGPTIIAIIVCAALAIIYWSMYVRKTNNGTISDYKISLINSPTVIRPDYAKSYLIPSLISDRKSFLVPGRGNGITIVLDMYINNAPMNANWGSSYGRSKPIIQIGESPCIYYTPKTGNLSLVLKYRDNPYYSNYPEIIYSDLKQQKWNKLIIVIDNRSIRFYLDGNIVKSQTIDGVPIIYDNEIKIGEALNNINGKIRQLDVYPLAADPDDINSL
jgi:hypothetical protein